MTGHAPLYISTRGKAPKLDLRGVTMAGLANDGGLYVPEEWPALWADASYDALLPLQGMPYLAVAEQVLHPFTQDTLPADTLRDLLNKAYGVFNHPDITPLTQMDDRLWLLELFHGPTLAFKDVALQFLGQLLGHFLREKRERLTVIGATSGDTGSAAMEALAGQPDIDVFILYPARGPSDIQRKQMTCVQAPQVHAIAIDGSFDDCQAIVKGLFEQQSLRDELRLTAVNSINWLRILAQMAYYVAAASRFAPRPVSFVVPTGNFGNIYAAYAAQACGMPVSKLAVASNPNDILTRFLASGDMQTAPVHPSLSPSMDIQISSNFERLLFDLCDRRGAEVMLHMQDLKQWGQFHLSPLQLAMARQLFTAARADDAETLACMGDIYKRHGIILDPHSAVGVSAAQKLTQELPEPVICLGCAHPAKFPDTVQRATGVHVALPEFLRAKLAQPERLNQLAANGDDVLAFIRRHRQRDSL
ncbi:MAG: threonine synthase [Alphaproteobacteria bacterium]|nr:threonine synthase [Alphaproteobacteria bacterium]